jgi:antirestriction protein ArdC
MAYYNITQDFVQMPRFEGFRDAESYYATLVHETTHYAAFRIMPNRCHRHVLARGERRHRPA